MLNSWWQQNAKIALDFADTAYILDTGSITLQGPPAELAENPDVKKSLSGGLILPDRIVL